MPKSIRSHHDIVARGTLERGRVSELMELALTALAAEDRALRLAFRANASAYDDDSHGLAYWLYETTLVYTIWKAWIPETFVVWDWPDGAGKRRFDLRVTDKSTTYAFEAKWCNSNAPMLLQKDADKLRKWGRSTTKAFLLAFWWNAQTAADDDERWIAKCAETLGSPTDYWFGRFHTHVRRGQAAITSRLRDSTDHATDVRHARLETSRPRASRPSQSGLEHYFGLACLPVSRALTRG